MEEMEDESDDEEEMEASGEESEVEDDESEIEDDLADDGMSDTQVKARNFMNSRDQPESEGYEEDGDDLDRALKQLKEDEKNESEFYQTRVSSEVEKGKSVRVQKKVFDQLLHQRILMQKLLQTANRVPAAASLSKFSYLSAKVGEGLTRSRRELKTYLKSMTEL